MHDDDAQAARGIYSTRALASPNILGRAKFFSAPSMPCLAAGGDTMYLLSWPLLGGCHHGSADFLAFGLAFPYARFHSGFSPTLFSSQKSAGARCHTARFRARHFYSGMSRCMGALVAARVSRRAVGLREDQFGILRRCRHVKRLKSRRLRLKTECQNCTSRRPPHFSPQLRRLVGPGRRDRRKRSISMGMQLSRRSPSDDAIRRF